VVGADTSRSAERETDRVPGTCLAPTRSDESHLLVFSGRPDRRVDRIERIVDWFERHL
jgi:hypothetical protein